MTGWPVQGLDALQDRLVRALAGGRLHHALLLTGPQGAGKRSIAGWIARGLLCASGEPGGCGTCGSCHRTDSGQHPDLLRVERPRGRTRIPVGDVRQAIGELEKGALEGRGRVALVLDADALNREGQNSLLKTLEEPAPRAWIVLTARRPEGLLDTVRSRVERISVPPLPIDALAHILATEAGLDPGGACEVALLAGGSLGRARDVVAEGLEEIRALCGALFDGTEAGPAAWARRVLAGADPSPGSLRQAKRDRAAQVLDLCLRRLAGRGRDGDAAAWDAVDRLLEARADLDLDLGADLVLQAAFSDLNAYRQRL